MLDTLSGWGGTDDWSDLEKPVTPAKTTQSATNPALEQHWNNASSGGAADPQADLLQQTGAAGTGAAAPSAPAQPPAPPPVDYTAHVAAVQNAASPQEAAVKQDSLARTLATDLQNDGHEVAWKDGQLVVDGRPYAVAGSTQTTKPATTSSSGAADHAELWDNPDAGFLPTDRPYDIVDAPAAPAAGPTAGPVAKTTDPTAPGAAAPHLTFGVGFDEGKLNDSTYVSSKYTPALRHFAALKDTLPPTTESLQTIAADAQKNGFPNARVTGKDTIDYGDGNGPIDVITDVGGPGAGWAFQNTTGNAQWETAHPQTGAPGAPPSAPGALGGDSWLNGAPTGPAGNYDLPTFDLPNVGAPGAPPAAAPASAPLDYNAMWEGKAPAYTPGSIGDANTPGYKDTLDAAGSYTPGGSLGDVQGGNYTAGTLGSSGLDWNYDSLMKELTSGNPVEGNVDSLMNQILQHPESMDPKTVAMLKAQSDEEQGQAALSEDNAAKRFGFNSGLADAPWLASERAATARTADASQIANRRNIDITAATTNAADRLKAASLGASYQGQRAGQKQAAVSTAGGLSVAKAGEDRSRFATTEQARQAQASTELAKAAEQRGRFSANEQTRQSSAASRQQAVSLAVDTAFKGAAEGRDRFALNESLKQQATQLGISQDKLTQDYVTNTIADLSKRHGIDVGANLDMARLGEQSKEFQQDLLVKIQQLKVAADQWKQQMEQRDREFGSNLGLQYDQLNSSNYNHWWDAVGGGA